MDEQTQSKRVLVDTDSIQTLSRKALRAPIIDDFSNARHTHENNQNGGAIRLPNLPVYANNAAAKAAGLVAGNLYRTSGDPSTVCVVYD